MEKSNDIYFAVALAALIHTGFLYLVRLPEASATVGRGSESVEVFGIVELQPEKEPPAEPEIPQAPPPRSVVLDLPQPSITALTVGKPPPEMDTAPPRARKLPSPAPIKAVPVKTSIKLFEEPQLSDSSELLTLTGSDIAELEAKLKLPVAGQEAKPPSKKTPAPQQQPQRPQVLAQAPQGRPPAQATPEEESHQSIKQSYLLRVMMKLNRAKRYPRRARLAGIEGRVEVEFVITTDGEVSEVKLVSSSGSPLLDRAGLNMVRDASPFDPIPEALSTEELRLIVPVVFKLHKQR